MSGIFISFKFWQLLKALFGIIFMLSDKITFFNEIQLSHILLPILVTLFGINNSSKDSHP